MLAKHCLRSEIYSVSIDHIVSAVDGDAAERIKTALTQRAATSTDTTTLVFDGVSIEIQPSVGDAVVQLLTYLAAGDSVALGPVAELLTTSQAAEILGVSDTYVRKLADAGKLPIELRGTHRRFRVDDVMAYREQFPKRA